MGSVDRFTSNCFYDNRYDTDVLITNLTIKNTTGCRLDENLAIRAAACDAKACAPRARTSPGNE